MINVFVEEKKTWGTVKNTLVQTPCIILIFTEKVCPQHFHCWAGFSAHTHTHTPTHTQKHISVKKLLSDCKLSIFYFWQFKTILQKWSPWMFYTSPSCPLASQTELYWYWHIFFCSNIFVSFIFLWQGKKFISCILGYQLLSWFDSSSWDVPTWFLLFCL